MFPGESPVWKYYEYELLTMIFISRALVEACSRERKPCIIESLTPYTLPSHFSTQSAQLRSTHRNVTKALLPQKMYKKWGKDGMRGWESKVLSLSKAAFLPFSHPLSYYWVKKKEEKKSWRESFSFHISYCLVYNLRKMIPKPQRPKTVGRKFHGYTYAVTAEADPCGVEYKYTYAKDSTCAIFISISNLTLM